MSYTSLGYMLFVACCLIFYYIFPKKHRWWVLLAASIGFYAIVCLKYISFVFVTAASTYADRKSTRLNSSHRHTSRMPSSA